MADQLPASFEPELPASFIPELPTRKAGEIGREDEQAISYDPNQLNQWIANQASKLPDWHLPGMEGLGMRGAGLREVAAAIGSASTDVPLSILTGIMGAPENYALSAASMMK